MGLDGPLTLPHQKQYQTARNRDSKSAALDVGLRWCYARIDRNSTTKTRFKILAETAVCYIVAHADYAL